MSLPVVAPATDTLVQVRDRLMHWLLTDELGKYDSCKPVAALYARRIAGDNPTNDEWRKARNAAAYANAAYAAARAANANAAAADAARSAARTRISAALVALLGDRLPTVDSLDARILRAVEGPRKRFGLDMVTWHSSHYEPGKGCGTTHCRAGAAVVLAGAKAKKLEEVFGPALTGGAIYYASTGRVPDFYASTEAALEDIRACAADAPKAGRGR